MVRYRGADTLKLSSSEPASCLLSSSLGELWKQMLCLPLIRAAKSRCWKSQQMAKFCFICSLWKPLKKS